MRRLSFVALLLLVPVPGAAQPAATAEIPRTPWGRPDLGGVWTNSTLTPLERPEEFGDREFHTAAEVAELQRVAVQERIDALPEPEATLAVEFSEIWMEPGPLSGRTSLVTGPTGKIPPTPPRHWSGWPTASDSRSPSGPTPMTIGATASAACASSPAVLR